VNKLKRKYYDYIDEHVKQYKNVLFKSYEEWLEDLVHKLQSEDVECERLLNGDFSGTEEEIDNLLFGKGE
jgi:hypothetical protein